MESRKIYVSKERFFFFFVFLTCMLQLSFNGSNTDGSFTTAVSNSFLSPLEKANSCRFGIIKNVFLIHTEDGIL